MRIVMPVYKHVEMLDVCGPYEMLRWVHGLDVDLVAETPGLVEFNHGFSFRAAANGVDLGRRSCDAAAAGRPWHGDRREESGR